MHTPRPLSPIVPSWKPVSVQAAGLRICSLGPLVAWQSVPTTRFGRWPLPYPVPEMSPLSPGTPVVNTVSGIPDAACAMLAISQSPNTFFAKPDLPSRVGSISTRLALKMCRRSVRARPRSRLGRARSVMLLVSAMPPLSSSGTSPMVFDQVYETWSCEPRPNRVRSCVCSEW